MTTLTVPRAELRRRIRTALVQAQPLIDGTIDFFDDDARLTWTEDCERWDARTRYALETATSDDAWPVEFHEAVSGAVYRYVNQDEVSTAEHRREAIRRSVNVLRSFDERLEYTTEAGQHSDPERRPATAGGDQVFVVHGRNDARRLEVVDFIRRVGLQPLVLADQPGSGQTIIESFESNSLHVGFAVAILDSDDFGKGPDESEWPDTPNRARQNVILELGYFMGALGRARTAALYVEGTEIPSDIHGLRYIRFSGQWKADLLRELLAAELPADATGI